MSSATVSSEDLLEVCARLNKMLGDRGTLVRSDTRESGGTVYIIPPEAAVSAMYVAVIDDKPIVHCLLSDVKQPEIENQILEEFALASITQTTDEKLSILGYSEPSRCFECSIEHPDFYKDYKPYGQEVCSNLLDQPLEETHSATEQPTESQISEQEPKAAHPENAEQLLQQKYAVIEEWMQKNVMHGVKQLDAAWFVARKDTIGGSTIATILGFNPYSTVEKLINDKLTGSQSFNGKKMVTQWGVLFEEIICRRTSMKHQTQIVGENVFLVDKTRDYLSYSPDGLAVIDGEITLMEFKCPFSRIPAKKVPKHYIPQLLMGMEMIDICTQSLFVESVIRKCPLKDLATHNIDESCGQKLPPALPFNSCGIIGFYIKEQNTKTSAGAQMYGRLAALRNMLPGGMHDLGSVHVSVFEIILDIFECGGFDVDYGEIHTTQSVEFAGNDLEKLRGELLTSGESSRSLFAYLPWKMYGYSEHIIKRDYGWLNRAAPMVESFINVVKQCKNPENSRKKHNIIESYLDKNYVDAESFSKS